MRSKCDCAHRRVKKNPPDPEIAPRRTDFFVYAERNSGERGTRGGRRRERDCGRRRHQKRTPFTKTNAGSIEAVRLVEVRRHRVAKCHRGVGPAVRCQWENRQSWPGSHVFLVGKKCDLAKRPTGYANAHVAVTRRCMCSSCDPKPAASFTMRLVWVQRNFLFLGSCRARSNTTVLMRCWNFLDAAPGCIG